MSNTNSIKITLKDGTVVDMRTTRICQRNADNHEAVMLGYGLAEHYASEMTDEALDSALTALGVPHAMATNRDSLVARFVVSVGNLWFTDR